MQFFLRTKLPLTVRRIGSPFHLVRFAERLSTKEAVACPMEVLDHPAVRQLVVTNVT